MCVYFASPCWTFAWPPVRPHEAVASWLDEGGRAMGGSTAFGEWPKNSREARGRRGDPGRNDARLLDADTEQIGLKTLGLLATSSLARPGPSVTPFHDNFKPQYTATNQPPQ